MKVTLLFLGLVLLIVFKSVGQDTMYACNWFHPPFPLIDMNERDTVDKYFRFDTTQSNNIWQLGIPSKILFDSAYSNPLALVTDTLLTYPNNNISTFTILVNTIDCNWGGLAFWHRLNTDSLSDGGVIEYSIDSGNSWNNIVNLPSFFGNYNPAPIASNGNKLGFTGMKDWTRTWFQGSLPSPNAVIEYRFTFTSDGINTNKDGWMIDDLLVENYGVDINEVDAGSAVHIFPNPTADFISISSDNITRFKKVSIANVFGQIILTTDETTIDLSNLATGIYFMQMTTDKGNFETKVLRK